LVIKNKSKLLAKKSEIGDDEDEDENMTEE
jgi:hypothetical protein